MWEDADAWNSYASEPIDTSWSSSDWYNDPSPGWSDSSWYGDPQTGWNDTSSWNDYTPPVSSGGSWQQAYDYTPRYQHGSTYNPSPAQITSGNPDLREMVNRVGSHEGAMYYRGFPGYENNPQLRDAEHYLSSEQMLSNPMANSTGIPQIAVSTLPAAYSGAKWLAQGMPSWLQPYLPSYLTQASAPSLNEVWSGMRPLWAPVR